MILSDLFDGGGREPWRLWWRGRRAMAAEVVDNDEGMKNDNVEDMKDDNEEGQR